MKRLSQAEETKEQKKKSEEKILDLVLGEYSGGQTPEGLECRSRKAAIPKGCSTEHSFCGMLTG